MPYNQSLLVVPISITSFNRYLVNVTAVKKETATPMVNVTAKPLIVPVPNIQSTTAAMSVVTLESKTAQNAFENHALREALSDLPRRSSSFILSKITTLASTAIPIERMIPAIPGKVRLALKSERSIKSRMV